MNLSKASMTLFLLFRRVLLFSISQNACPSTLSSEGPNCTPSSRLFLWKIVLTRKTLLGERDKKIGFGK